MKALITFLVHFCCLFIDSSSLRFYEGNETNLVVTVNTCPERYSKFNAIYMYKSGENILNRQSCADNTICKESGTSELDMYCLDSTVR